MSEIQAGITALITAYARAYHATHDSPLIFDDSLADQYYTPEEHTRFNSQLATQLPAIDPALAATNPPEAEALAVVMQTMHLPITLSRSRYTEDCLEAALGQGVAQYVSLGAGFDTFAFRRSDLAPRLQVFELDHPVTQALKQQRIAQAGWTIPANLHLLPIDFTSQSLSDVLHASTYNPLAQTFFSWLGVTYYLTSQAITQTLQALPTLAPAGSSLVFDYLDQDAFDPARVSPRAKMMQATTQRIGEPMKTGFDPRTLAAFLQPFGLHLTDNLTPADIQARYFTHRSDRLRAFEHVHFAHTILKS